ncbi:MAG: phosphotransferase enzyme family protein [Anaerolineae bacterium]
MVNDIHTIAARVAAQFQPVQDALIQRLEPYGSGNINDTFLVEVKSADRGSRFILQRINQSVFPRPKLIMVNLRAVFEHVADKPDSSFDRLDRRWELPNIVTTVDGRDYLLDDEGEFWRALTFIEDAKTYPKVKDSHHAGEAGYALGRFQRLINDLDTSRLHDTLPGFHIMPHYLDHYDEVVEKHDIDLSSPEVRYGVACVARNRDWATVLQDALAAGRLQERPIHGDPKIDNIMIDNATGKAVSIIDLDTVKPGLVQYDIGDCLRSSCNPLGEETHEIDQVAFDLDLCEAILEGYFPQVREFYTPEDEAYLYDSVRVLAFEMALRFFTDYLEGDVYFKTRYPEHNLMRALVQFRLMESIEAQERQIGQIIHALARA